MKRKICNMFAGFLGITVSVLATLGFLSKMGPGSALPKAPEYYGSAVWTTNSGAV